MRQFRLVCQRSTAAARPQMALQNSPDHGFEADGNKRRLFLPPRVAISIMSLDGEVLALAGWPRSSTTGSMGPVVDVDGKTKSTCIRRPQWLATQAPAAIRNRYLGDRNFDLLVAGSSSKPIWAAASLECESLASSRLSVRGAKVDQHALWHRHSRARHGMVHKYR
jgi:hypothetical protein